MEQGTNPGGKNSFMVFGLRSHITHISWTTMIFVQSSTALRIKGVMIYPPYIRVNTLLLLSLFTLFHYNKCPLPGFEPLVLLVRSRWHTNVPLLLFVFFNQQILGRFPLPPSILFKRTNQFLLLCNHVNLFRLYLHLKLLRVEQWRQSNQLANHITNI